MRILVTTPTGKIGRLVVRELLAPEFSVRVLTRHPERLPEEILEQVEVVRGSNDDAATLRQALKGIEALFWCVPGAAFEIADVLGHYERFACSGCRAIREAGTPRVVTISAIGKGSARNTSLITGLHTMEDILNDSGAAIRHVRCCSLMENFLSEAQSICERGIISYPMAGHIPIPMAAASDIADVALRWLVRRTWHGSQPVPVHGPEDLTFNQAAAIIERVLERPVRYREVSPEEYIRAWVDAGASVGYARSFAGMFAELAQGITRVEPRTTESTTITTFATWVENELVPLLESIGFQPEVNGACASMCEI